MSEHTVCPTCDADGTKASPFDANCPAAWAHGYLKRPIAQYCGACHDVSVGRHVCPAAVKAS